MRRATDVGGGFGCLLPFLTNIRKILGWFASLEWYRTGSFGMRSFAPTWRPVSVPLEAGPFAEGLGVMRIRAGSPLFAFSQLFGSARFTHLTPITVSTPKSLPDLLEELNHNLAAVDATTEQICRVMVRRAVVTNEVPVPLDKLAKLCGLLQMVRDCVTGMEERL